MGAILGGHPHSRLLPDIQRENDWSTDVVKGPTAVFTCVSILVRIVRPVHGKDVLVVRAQEEARLAKVNRVHLVVQQVLRKGRQRGEEAREERRVQLVAAVCKGGEGRGGGKRGRLAMYKRC